LGTTTIHIVNRASHATTGVYMRLRGPALSGAYAITKYYSNGYGADGFGAADSIITIRPLEPHEHIAVTLWTETPTFGNTSQDVSLFVGEQAIPFGWVVSVALWPMWYVNVFGRNLWWLCVCLPSVIAALALFVRFRHARRRAVRKLVLR